MTTSSVKGRTSISLLAGAALMAQGLIVPQKAHADLATATILGGMALFTSLAHASEPAAPVIAYPQASVPPPLMMARPVAMPMPMLNPIYEPMVYTSVSPIAPAAPMIPQMQQISYQVSAPSAPPLNMASYQTGPSPVYQQPMQQQMQMPQQQMQMPQQQMQMPQQQMQMPQQQMQMPQQQSYQQYSTGGMPVTAGYQQGQQQGYPMMQQAAMMPQQQAAMMPQQQQQAAMMPQGGYGASMPSTTFAYAR